MSVSKWRWTKECDSRMCIGDCDLCDYDLKVCPFCGSKVEKFKAPFMETIMFRCGNCGADVCFYGAEKEPKASKAWNRREKK